MASETSSTSTTALLDEPIGRSQLQKIRDSCDACAKSKVRCGKQHPKCARCDARDIPCNYSIVQRKGRRRLSERLAHTPPPENMRRSSSPGLTLPDKFLATLSYHGLESLADELTGVPRTAGNSGDDSICGESCQDGFSPRRPKSPPRSVSFPDYTDVTGQLDFHFPLDWSNLDQEMSTHDGGLGLASPLPPVVRSVPDTMDNSSHYHSHHHDSDASLSSLLSMSSLSTTSLATSSSSISSVTDRSSPPHEQQSCVERTLSTLQALHSSSENCILNSRNDQPRSLDKVLHMNQTALANISSVVSCPCSLDYNFALLITQAVTKILSWYQAILDDNDAVQMIPIKIGQLELDLGNHKRMVAQVVEDDLAKVEKLLENFIERNCRAKQFCNEFEQPLYSSLESLLRTKLNDIFRLVRSEVNGGRST